MKTNAAALLKRLKAGAKAKAAPAVKRTVAETVKAKVPSTHRTVTELAVDGVNSLAGARIEVLLDGEHMAVTPKCFAMLAEQRRPLEFFGEPSASDCRRIVAACQERTAATIARMEEDGTQ